MSNTILFHGNDGDMVDEQMRLHAAEVLGIDKKKLLNHPDYQEVYPENTNLHSMKAILSIINESSLPPYQSKNRVIAILSADKMLPVHSNAILKMLEDAPMRFHLFLTTISYDDIIKTILSRMQKRCIVSNKINVDYISEIEELFGLLDGGRYNTFLSKLDDLDKAIKEDISTSKQKVRVFLESYLLVYSRKITDKHLMRQKLSFIDTLLADSLEAFAVNISVKRIFENLFLGTQP